MKTISKTLIKIAVLTLLLASGYASSAILHINKLDDLTSLPLEDLLNIGIQSASKFRQHTKEAPSAASVITSNEIKYFGWKTLSEIINALPGIHLSNDRNYTYVGARGFLRSDNINSRFLLLIDGHRMNDPIFDQASVGNEFHVDVISLTESNTFPVRALPFMDQMLFSVLSMSLQSGHTNIRNRPYLRS